MNRFVRVALLMGTAFLYGCSSGGGTDSSPSEKNLPPQDSHVDHNSPASSGSMDEVIAKVRGEPLTMRELVDPLIESRGLTMLINLVELNLAKQNAANYHVVVAPEDFVNERDVTLEKLFKNSDDPKLVAAMDKAVAGEMSKDPNIVKESTADEARLLKQIKLDREDYLVQFLLNQHIDPVEFEIVLKINTYLRKILALEWKDQITEDDLKGAFGQMYGEKVKVEYILLDNMNQVGIANRRLAAGDSFEQVAKDMSRDRLTGPNGGELEAFSREAKIPPSFKDVAFSLKDGQVSDVITAGSSFQLIKRIRTIPPQVVKYEDVKPAIRRRLYSTLMETGLKGMKRELGIQAQKEMKILNPVLAKQFKDRVEHDANADKKANEELNRHQQLQDLLKTGGATRPADTEPATGTAPATGAASTPIPAATGERPPATMPGTAHKFILPRLGPDTNPSTEPDVNK